MANDVPNVFAVRLRALTLGTLAIAALSALGLASDPSPAVAQGPVSAATAFPGQPPTPPDSAALLDQAHDAQRRFERIRRRHLPWSWGGYGGECDERVGRMCWHHDDPEDDWTKPDEPEELIQARERLVDTLSGLLSGIPGDRWVLAQLVWYLGEGGRWDQAARLTQECPGQDDRWCAALLGLALHEMGDYVEAARAFDHAGSVIDEMGGDERAELRVLLDRDGRGLLGKPSASAELLAPDSLLWLLADPMVLISGNDRRTEHEARRMVNRIRTGARNPYSMGWGKDMSELVIRFGWAEAWERVRGNSGSTEPASIVGRHPPKGRRYMPPTKALSNPLNVAASDLQPIARRPRTTYRPNYAQVIRPMEAEVIALDRQDSLLLVVALADSKLMGRLPGDPSTTPGTDNLAAFSRGAFAIDLTSGEVTRGEPAGPRSWTIRTPNRPQMVSVEHLPDSFGEAYRHRRAVAAATRHTDVAGLSELMVLEAGAEPTSLEEAAARLRSTRIFPGETVTLAWEAYGLGFDDASLAYEVRIGRRDGGILSTLAGWIGAGEGDNGLLIDWTEAQPADPGPQLRYVSITFPALQEGTYSLRLALQLAGRSAVVREREFVVSSYR